MGIGTTSRISSVLANSTLVYFLIFVVSFLALYKYGRKLFRAAQISYNIPGPGLLTSLKLAIGSITAEPHDVFVHGYKMLSEYKDIAKIWLGPRLFIFLHNPADIEVILSSNVHLDKSTDYNLFKPWFGNGLLISTGPKWKHHRKMIAPTFHQSILKNFVSTFYANSVKVCDKMAKENGKSFDAHEYMSGTTVDILLETAMGYNVPRSEETGFNYAMAVMKLSDIIHRSNYSLLLRSNVIFQRTKMALEYNNLLKVVKSLTTKVVANKKGDVLRKGVDNVDGVVDHIETNGVTELKKNEKISGYNNGTAIRDDLDENDANDVGAKKRLAFLEQLTVNAQRKDVDFTEEEVLDQVNTIMFEGHDTTAAGSSFTLCLLGIHKDIQERCIKEIDEIFQKSDRPCTFADTNEMKYLERVIMESLRMFPPVPLIGRQLREEVKLPSGNYSLPIGTTVLIVQAALHRRPDVFPNPNVFNPDNFLPEKCQERHYYSYVPFSAGPRSCVGRKFAMLKLKVMLSTILRQFRVHSDQTEDEFKLRADLILKRDDGFNIRLQPRKDALIA